MKKTLNNLKIFGKRNGAAAAVVVILLLVAVMAGIGAAYLHGKSLQTKQAELVKKGYQLFNEGRLQEAYPTFAEARKAFGQTLEFYRRFAASDSYMNPQELNELLASICLSAAHERFFELDSDDGWLEKAEEALNKLEAGERREELAHTIKTAEAVNRLCIAFKAADYETALKDLLEVEKQAHASDQDFFIFEIRFLIACGKALENPDIIKHARELLFFATTDAGINNEKTAKLWVLLTS